MTERLRHRHPAFGGLVGCAQADISPPGGIFARNWGASDHDRASGVHQPLTTQVIAFASESAPAPLVLVSLDLGWWRDAVDELSLRRAVLEGLGLPGTNLIMSMTHTHAGPSTSRADADRPGGHLVSGYLDYVRTQLLTACRRAVGEAAPAVLEWDTGRCSLARNRDLRDRTSGRTLCGFNPAAAADDTVLVGRITGEDGATRAVIVNYACHPTTLAWQNTLVSPDFVGSTRSLVTRDTGAPCVFVQGASGELAPRRQYTADVGVAEANGRQLGYAVLSVLEGMLPARTGLYFAGVVESGAPLGLWESEPVRASAAIRSRCAAVRLPCQEPVRPRSHRSDSGSPFERERAERARRMMDVIGPEPEVDFPVTLWRMGETLVIAQPGEAYSWLQTHLRSRFPDHGVVVVNLANGPHMGYLPTEQAYGTDTYQVWQTRLARGSLEALGAFCERALRELLEPGPRQPAGEGT